MITLMVAPRDLGDLLSYLSDKLYQPNSYESLEGSVILFMRTKGFQEDSKDVFYLWE